MKTHTILHRKAQVNVTDYGKGPCVVLLHGYLENNTMWHSYAKKLAKRYRVLAIDLPGHGKSEPVGYYNTMELMADTVKAVLKKFRIKKSVLIGHSMGGYVALAYGEKYPDATTGICLFFSTAYADSEQKKLDRERAAELIQLNTKSYIRKAIPALFRPKSRIEFREELEHVRNEALKTPAQGILALLHGMKDRPNRDYVLAFAPFPKLIVAGQYDAVLPLQSLVDQANQSKNTEINVFKCGHMGHIEEREACFDAIERFTRKCTGAPRL